MKQFDKIEHTSVIEGDEGNTLELSFTENIIYDDHFRFMVSWWGRDSYLSHEQIQSSDVEIINSLFGSSRLFGSRVRSKFIGNDTYTGRRRNFDSKPIAINGPAHKSELFFLYSRIHFSW